MTPIWKKLIVLLWKCVVLRKRNWLLTIFEFVSPILLVLSLYAMKVFVDKQTKDTKDSMNFEHISRPNQSSDYRISSSLRKIYNSPVNIEDSTYIAYAPNTVLIDELMTAFKTSVEISDPHRKLSVESKRNEADLERALRENLLPNSGYRSVLGILFNDQNMTYRYKIMGNFEDVSENTQNADTSSMLFKLQVYLDAQYLKSVGVNYEDSKVLIGEFIYSGNVQKSDEHYDSKNIESKIYLTLLHIFLMFTYSFLVTAVVRDAIQEKSSGIKELMRVMGLSSWMIWVHWFIYSMFIQIPVTVIITVLLTLIPPHVVEANAFIVWVLFFLVTIDYIVILFVVTCFFERATKATVVCVLLWIIINFALLFILHRTFSFPVQILISLIPMVNLSWTLQSLQSFHIYEVDWDLSYLFTEGIRCSKVSAGVGIIILICEIILFTLLLAYIDAVKPGRYGVAKPLTFIFDYCIKQWQNMQENEISGRSSLPAHFELPPPGTKVGIGIRGLHKKFGVFKKVVAVECVNLDIYEREVTVLLGHNGAGKTTTMSMITGMFSPTSGTVTVDGKNIYENLYNFRQNLGLCTQHNLYFPKLTVFEHLVFFGMLKGRSRSQAKEEGRYLLYMLNMVDKKDLRGSKLSGGMLRRLCLAVALTGAPKVLILDEPTSGLDPENRRHIWDIILSLRGERTILLTTHYMEEADVLGDRIAIMDHGKVVCCGTTMFLKKMYGAGYNVHVTKSPRASSMDITQTVERYIPQFTTKVVSPAQVDYCIKDEFVERFPNLFSALESSMSVLGVTAISVSCTTMEDVFLRVAELTEGQDQDDEQKQSTAFRDDCIKVEGVTLILQRIEALIVKRALYISKHLISTIIKFIFSCLIILGAMLLADNFKHKDSEEDKGMSQRNINLKVNPDDFIYPIIYDESNIKTAKVAQTIIESTNKGRVFMMKLENASQYAEIDSTNQPMNMFLSNIAHYANNLSNRVVLASTFIDDDLLIQYQRVFNPYSSSNAANLMANVLLKQTHPDRNIAITSQSLSSNRDCKGFMHIEHYVYTVIILYFLITIALTITMSGFTSLTVEERVTGFKYQQIIAGVSPLIFHLSNMFCDVCLYIVFVLIWFVIVLIVGSDIIPVSSENMEMFILVLILYGVSSIVFINAFSLISKSAATTTGLYIVINLVLMLVCAISLLIMPNFDFYIQIIVTVVLSFHPTAAGFFALYIISLGIANYSVCYSANTESYLGLPSPSNRFSILIFVVFLVVDIVLYSIILFLVDSKIFARLTYKRSGINDCQGGDNDVKYETQRVRMFKEAKVETNPLRVEGLVKNYGSLRAANQVSFLVSRGECFGLLGVNGAGKTTTFKMLTGEISPSSGDAVSTKYSVVSQTQEYLSNIGYCPQFDALLDDLTGNNTLTIIAKIRGVPRSEVRRQVDYWMKALGIEEHAHKATHTYSGGTKRKLGTAMAFIGEPLVALLDEPTTGVDPAARRKVWSAVKERQSAGFSAVLSSHSMEECEALCSRLTIMRRGELCCIGSVQELKTKFGQGFVVLLKLTATEDYRAQLESLKKDFLRTFPKSVIQDENINMMTYRVVDGKAFLSKLFSEVIRLKRKYTIIEDFIVSNATLEQLFLAIARGVDIRYSVRPEASSPNPNTRATVNFDV